MIKVRRDYNTWVASETLEDYALRFTPRASASGREWRVANTALRRGVVPGARGGGRARCWCSTASSTRFWAILATGLIIFLAGLPISIYAARHGAGHGPAHARRRLRLHRLARITSLIYASFTFIFFALEAAIMAYALELAFDIPPAWGYLICALVVIPLVTHGVTAISRLQVWTQPLWLLMLVLPYVYRASRTTRTLLAGSARLRGEQGGSGAASIRCCSAPR